MTDNNPTGSDGNSGGDDKPPTKYHGIAAAINSLEAAYESTHKHRHENDEHALLWAKRAAKGVFIYTALTVAIVGAGIWSSWNAQRAVDLSAHNVVVEQRPYLWLAATNEGPAIHNSPDGKVQITWSWFYTNYGKTPARHLMFDHLIRLGNDKPFLPPFDDPAHPHPHPNIGAPLPPGKIDTATVVSPPIAATDAADLFLADSGVTIAGILTYEDAYGNGYETDFCIGKLKTGAVLYEPAAPQCHNEIK